jgi:hypothetical protein
MKSNYHTGSLAVNGSRVSQVSTALNASDFLGAVMVRWGINRDKYRVEPGLYAVGTPLPDSDVFVTANYKLTFDQLRKNLAGVDGWILVLDTKGVNVWCAAGKGTFGTVELVNRINSVSLEKIVSHRRLIVPQLGATGVAAHKVKEATGFNVHYGPVLASDIRKFIDAGYRADREMRKVKFGFVSRAKLIPNDFMYGKYYLLGAMLLLFVLSGLGGGSFSSGGFAENGAQALITVLMAYIAGTVITPLFLPYIPGRYFSLKGFFSGMLVFLGYLILSSHGDNLLIVFSWFMIAGAFSSFLAMNFTGSTTFTSLSGVKKEMKLFIPLQATMAAGGIIIQIIGKMI